MIWKAKFSVQYDTFRFQSLRVPGPPLFLLLDDYCQIILPMVFVLLSVKYGNFQWFLSSLSVKYGNFQWFLSHSQWSMETSNGFCLTLSEVWKLPMVFVLLSVKYGHFQWFLSYSQWSMDTSNGFCLTLSEVWKLPMVFVLLSVKYGNFQWFLSYSQWSMETSNGFSLSEVW